MPILMNPYVMRWNCTFILHINDKKNIFNEFESKFKKNRIIKQPEVSLRFKNELLTWSCRAGSFGQFDIIYVHGCSSICDEAFLDGSCLITISIIKTKKSFNCNLLRLRNSDKSYLLICSDSYVQFNTFLSNIKQGCKFMSEQYITSSALE